MMGEELGEDALALELESMAPLELDELGRAVIELASLSQARDRGRSRGEKELGKIPYEMMRGEGESRGS